MRLSDVMSAMELHRYAEVALVLFMIAFAAVAIDVFRRKKSLEPLRYLPLDEHEDDR
ncbi:MAG: hypothetical protein DIU78_020840 [Pseudomonadota bacterium]